MSITVTLSNPGSPVTLSQTRILVELANVGPQGPIGLPGTAAATEYARSSLPAAPADGSIAQLSDSHRGVMNYQGGGWVSVGNERVNVQSFGVRPSPVGAPVLYTAELAAAQDSLEGLPGVLVFPPPRAQNVSGVGYGVAYHMEEPLVLANGQMVDGINGGAAGAAATGAPGFETGTLLKPVPTFVGDHVIQSITWLTGSFWHEGGILNLGIDCADVCGGVGAHQMGEQTVFRRVQVWRHLGNGFDLTGVHAVGQIEDCSAWYGSGYGVKCSRHPTLTGLDALNAGHLRFFGFSGDKNGGGHIYFDGGHHLFIELKSEKHTICVVAGNGDGARIGGGAAKVVFAGTVNGDGAPSPATDLVLIQGPTPLVAPIFNFQMLEHSGVYTNLIRDLSNGKTLPASLLDSGVAQIIWNGSWFIGGSGEAIIGRPLQGLRPFDGSKRVLVDYGADDIAHFGSGVAGSSLDDESGVKVVYAVSSVAEITGLIRPEADATRDIGQSVDGVFERRFKDLYQKGYHDMTVLTADPAAPPAGHVRRYSILNGSGKVETRDKFPTGVVQVVATEP